MLSDVKLLQLFDQLYRTRSVSRAAELLGQAQPTVSIWLGRLRQDMGDPLFVRTAAGMAPTPRADALIPTVRLALEMLERLTERQQEFDPSQSERRFRICMTDASHITLLPRLFRALRETGPGIRVEALQIDADTGRKLASGEADLALGLIPGLESGFYRQTLFHQDWVCMTHPRMGHTLSRSAYEAAGHVDVIFGTGHWLLGNAVAAERITRRVVLELSGFLGLAGIVSATDLLATLPRQSGETLARAGGLHVLPCPFPIQGFDVKQHWHERYHNDPGNRWLRRVIAELFQEREAP